MVAVSLVGAATRMAWSTEFELLVGKMRQNEAKCGMRAPSSWMRDVWQDAEGAVKKYYTFPINFFVAI